MPFLAMLAAAVVLDATAATQPAAPDTTVSPAVVNGKTEKPEMICRTEAVMGTRFTKKICVSKAEAEAHRNEDRQVIERMQTQQIMNGPGS